MKATVLTILLAFAAVSKAEDLYVEETGENEIIPIETKSEVHKIVKRQKGDYSYDDDEDYTDFEASGDEANYDLDTYDDEDDPYDTPVMPSRVIPPLISPSFDDYGNVVSTPVVLSKSALDVLKTSLYIQDDLEGSGQDDFRSTIVATKASTMMTPEATLMPTFTTDLDEDVITDATSPKLPAINQAPFVQKKLRKFAVTAGRSLRIQIPEETFFDMEDGNTRQLRVDIRQEDGTPLRIPWLKYDPTIQTIFALPFDENRIGRYTFKIVATDSQGSSTFDLLEIVVRQYSGARLVNHEFTVEFSFTNWRPETTKGWEWHMLDKIRQLYGDSSPENILVRQIGENPWVFSWTNDSLTQQTCPKTDIRGLFAQLVEGEDAAYKSMFGSANARLKALLGDEIYVKSVAMKYLGTCLLDETGYRNQDNTGAGSNPGQEDSVPVIRNPIDTINVTAGELLRYKVPEDTCYDQEDGKTSRLNLHLLTTNRRELSPEAWLQFDGKNQEFVGIPLEEEVGREEYQLVCSDANGLSAIDGIQVVVINRPFNERFGVEFSLQFGHKDYGGVGMDGFALGQPILRPDMKVSIVESLANYFGDGSTSNIILRVFDADNGKLVWHNKSLAQLPCDANQVLWVKNHLLDSKGQVVKALIRHFQPYLKLVDANAVKQGQCVTGAIPPVPTSGTPEGGSGSGLDRTIFHGIIPSADYLLTFIIPAVIITCMLILAILLACMLHKKRKAGKLNLFYSEALPPRVPVILQDELFDDQDNLAGGGHKQPVLLREDLMNNGLMQSRSSQENETLLQHQRPIQIDPYGRGSSLGRPTPAYQRRQL